MLRRPPQSGADRARDRVVGRATGLRDALGYEDLIDHDQLRHDPVLAALGGKLDARRSSCAALAGKSMLIVWS